MVSLLGPYFLLVLDLQARPSLFQLFLTLTLPWGLRPVEVNLVGIVGKIPIAF